MNFFGFDLFGFTLPASVLVGSAVPGWSLPGWALISELKLSKKKNKESDTKKRSFIQKFPKIKISREIKTLLVIHFNFLPPFPVTKYTTEKNLRDQIPNFV